jgi:two-component system sensor histidine kinase KdpD
MSGSTGERSTAMRYALALLVCAMTTLLVLPLFGHLDLANIVLLFTLAVVAVATWLGRGPAVLASFVAVACFDVFFVPPRFSFTVADAQYLITFVVMLLVALVITHLTAAFRRKAREAEQRAQEATFLQAVASALSGAMTMAQAAALLDGLCREHFAIDARLFVATVDNQLQAVDGGGEVPDGDVQRLADVVFRKGNATALPLADAGDRVTLLRALEGATRRRGVIALRCSREQASGEALWTALSAVVATAVERIHYVDVALATTLDMQSERLRSSILSAIAHDLRTPLTVLYGLADTLAGSDGLSDEQVATAAALRDQSHRMHRTVDNLLDMARLRSGRIVLRLDWQSIPELVGASAQSMAPWLDAARLQFRWPAALPLLRLDALLMQRVWCNVLENAAKYSPPGSTIAIGAEVIGTPESGSLRVWFDNAGGGFPTERLERVFDLFERGEVAASVNGMGVGLAVCRAIVEAHGGRIEAINRDGGARVLIELPLSVAPTMQNEQDLR